MAVHPCSICEKLVPRRNATILDGTGKASNAYLCLAAGSIMAIPPRDKLFLYLPPLSSPTYVYDMGGLIFSVIDVASRNRLCG